MHIYIYYVKRSSNLESHFGKMVINKTVVNCMACSEVGLKDHAPITQQYICSIQSGTGGDYEYKSVIF
jgi:hypothetical protein